MRIVGVGVDLVEVARIERSLTEHGDRFLERCFTPGERARAADSRRRTEHLAARFAAKEAALKALGTGWRHGISWTDVEVVNDPAGRPMLRVEGEAGRIAAGLGVRSWWVSLSHTPTHAVATVIASGEAALQ